MVEDESAKDEGWEGLEDDDWEDVEWVGRSDNFADDHDDLIEEHTASKPESNPEFYANAHFVEPDNLTFDEPLDELISQLNHVDWTVRRSAVVCLGQETEVSDLVVTSLLLALKDEHYNGPQKQDHMLRY